jgi:1,2-alpha-glucosylglycerol phosphorylase
VYLKLNTERFASYEDLHIIPMRFKLKALAGVKLALYTGIDSQTWDLNGKHLPDLAVNIRQRSMSVTGMTKQSGLEVAVSEGHNLGGIKPLQVEVATRLGPWSILFLPMLKQWRA